jgi:hypothetical protein
MSTRRARLRPWRVLLAPLWLAALATDAKSFAANPIIGSRWLNRWGLHEARMRVAAKMAAARRRRLGAQVSAQDREDFLRDGFVVKPGFLPDSDFKRLRDEVFAGRWDVVEARQGPTVTRRAPLDLADLAASKPVLARFLEDHGALALMRFAAAAAGRPRFAIQAVLTDPQRSAEDPQCRTHCDSFHPMAKAWFFLTDVGPDDGPFFYVPGSHRLTAARAAWSRGQSLTAGTNPDRDHANGLLRASEEDLRRLGLPEPRRFTVPANTLVIADVFGFHGRTPRRSTTTRVELYGVLRRNPFAPWSGLQLSAARPALRRFGLSTSQYRTTGAVAIDAPAQV